MANEVSYSGLTTDARLSQVLAQEIEVILHDQASLMGHPAIRYAGDMAGRGSTVIKIPRAGLQGYNRMAAVSEGSSTSNTALTTANTTITIARQGLQRQAYDLVTLTDPIGGVGGINVIALAADMVASAMLRFTEMVCGVTAFTSNAGTSGAVATIDDWFTAQFTLTQASVPAAAALAVVYPKQLTNLQNSLRGESGAMQWMAATADMIARKGQGFAGSLLGTDIFVSALIPTANAGVDSSGMMFGTGAIAYADGSPSPIVSYGVQYPGGTKIYVEFERDAAATLTKIVGNYFLGVSKDQDALGCSLTTVR